MNAELKAVETIEFIKTHNLKVIEHEFLHEGSAYEVHNKHFSKWYNSHSEMVDNLQSDYLLAIAGEGE